MKGPDREASGVESISLLHVLAGVSLGISIAMAPAPGTAGAGVLLVVVALVAVVEGLLSRRKRRRASTGEKEWVGETVPAYLLLILCLVAFFLVVRRLVSGGFGLWLSCAVFAAGIHLWRDYNELYWAVAGDTGAWSRPRVFSLLVGLSPAFYYLAYGFAGFSSTGFWAVAAALFHAAAIVFVRLIDGPLQHLVLEYDDRAVARLLRGVEESGCIYPQPGGASARADVSKTGDMSAEQSSDRPSCKQPSASGILSLSNSGNAVAADAESPAVSRGAHVSDDALEKITGALSDWEQGDEDKALDAFLAIVAAHPDLEEPTLWAVQLLVKKEMPDQARELLVSFLRRNGDCYAGYFQLGRILAGEGKGGLARRAFVKASLINRRALGPVRELARLAAADGDMERAAGLAAVVRGREPEDPWVREFFEELESSRKRRRVMELREQARALLARRDRGAALAVFKEMVAIDPVDTESRLKSARILLDTGDPDEAVSVFSQALSLPFEHRAGHELPVELAGAYMKRGETDRALAELDRSTSHFPLHVDLAFLRIECLLQKDDRERLDEYLAGARSPSAAPEQLLAGAYTLIKGEAFGYAEDADVDSLVSSFLERARRAGAPSAPYEPTVRFEARLAELEGRLLARRGRIDEALSKIDDSVALDPRCARALCCRAEAALQSGLTAKAVVSFDQLTKLCPLDARWRWELLQALYRNAVAEDNVSGSFAALYEHYKVLLDEKPDDPLNLFGLGALLTLFLADGESVALRRFRAGHYLRMSVKAKPGEPWFIIGLARYYVASTEGDEGTNKAIKLLDKAGARMPTCGRLLFEKARLMASFVAADKVDELADIYRRAIELSVDDADPVFGLGRLLVVANRLEEARKYFERGLKTAPLHREARSIREMVETMSTL